MLWPILLSRFNQAIAPRRRLRFDCWHSSRQCWARPTLFGCNKSDKRFKPRGAFNVWGCYDNLHRGKLVRRERGDRGDVSRNCETLEFCRNHESNLGRRSPHKGQRWRLLHNRIPISSTYHPPTAATISRSRMDKLLYGLYVIFSWTHQPRLVRSPRNIDTRDSLDASRSAHRRDPKLPRPRFAQLRLYSLPSRPRRAFQKRLLWWFLLGLFRSPRKIQSPFLKHLRCSTIRQGMRPIFRRTLVLDSPPISLGQTPLNPTNSIFILGDEAFAPKPTGLIITGSAVVPGSPPTTVSGMHILLNPSSELILGDSTMDLKQKKPATPLRVGGQAFTANPRGFAIGPKTVLPGSAPITISRIRISLDRSGQVIIGSKAIINHLPHSTLLRQTCTRSADWPLPSVFLHHRSRRKNAHTWRSICHRFGKDQFE